MGGLHGLAKFRLMLKADPEAVRKLGDLVQECGFEPELKKMFGHQVYFLNGYMFCGANESGVFVHLGRETVQDCLDIAGVGQFEAKPGVPMKDYLQLEHSVSSKRTKLKDWLIKSGQYLESRPTKVKKSRK